MSLSTIYSKTLTSKEVVAETTVINNVVEVPIDGDNETGQVLTILDKEQRITGFADIPKELPGITPLNNNGQVLAITDVSSETVGYVDLPEGHLPPIVPGNTVGQVLTITDVGTESVAYQDLPPIPSSTKQYFTAVANKDLNIGSLAAIPGSSPAFQMQTNLSETYSLFDFSYATFVTAGDASFAFVDSTNGSGYPGRQLQYQGTETKRFKVHFDSCLGPVDQNNEVFYLFAFTSSADPYFILYPNPVATLPKNVAGRIDSSPACSYVINYAFLNGVSTSFVVELNTNDYINIAIDNVSGGGANIRVTGIKFVINEL